MSLFSAAKNLSIGTKNIIALSILLLPLAFMVYFLISEKDDLINFTSKEIVGVRDIRPLKAGLALLAVVPPSKSDLAPAITAIKDTLDTGPASLADHKKLEDLLHAMNGVGVSTAPVEAIGNTTDLISSLSDVSNITLDPDADAYFVGDIIVNQLTGVVVQANALLGALADAENDRQTSAEHKTSIEHKIAFAEARDGLASSAGNVSSELIKAIAGNTDGSVQKNLTDGAKALSAAADQVSAAIKAADAAAVRTAAAAVIKAANDLNNPLCDEMDHLLQARNAGFHHVVMTRLVTIFAMLLVGLFISLRVVKSITRPLHDIAELMGRLSQGDLDVVVPETERQDEIGTIARAADVLRLSSIKARSMGEEQQAEQKAKEARAVRIDRTLNDFDSSMNVIFKTLTDATGDLENTAGKMTAIAEQTSNQANTVTTVASQASSNVQTVASAAEELAASIAEISRQVQEANGVATEAVQIVQGTSASMESLSDNARLIGDVVSLITDIAEQTNLLALNVTIEAARAGDAGKGFSVVAAEVKNLAGQTSKATENISRQIAAIQQSTAGAVGAIKQISDTIERISRAQTTIAAAIEEQGAATQEISRNVVEASSGTAEVSRNMADVSAAAGRTEESASGLLTSSKNLAQQTELLKKEVQKFMTSVKAA